MSKILRGRNERWCHVVRANILIWPRLPDSVTRRLIFSVVQILAPEQDSAIKVRSQRNVAVYSKKCNRMREPVFPLWITMCSQAGSSSLLSALGIISKMHYRRAYVGQDRTHPAGFSSSSSSFLQSYFIPLSHTTPEK